MQLQQWLFLLTLFPTESALGGMLSNHLMKHKQVQSKLEVSGKQPFPSLSIADPCNGYLVFSLLFLTSIPSPAPISSKTSSFTSGDDLSPPTGRALGRTVNQGAWPMGGAVTQVQPMGFSCCLTPPLPPGQWVGTWPELSH